MQTNQLLASKTRMQYREKQEKNQKKNYHQNNLFYKKKTVRLQWKIK